MKSPARILVVDDDAGARRLTRATLAKAGFHVSEAGDGQAALTAMAGELPDLVLMDVSMPLMDGFDACAALRQLPGGGVVPVAMITGLDDTPSIEGAFEVGATDFITKPINWTVLQHRVRYMLRASTAINHLEQSQRRLSNAQRIGEMGDWEWDVRENRIAPSAEAWRILGHTGEIERLSLERFFTAVHHDDAEQLKGACSRAVAGGDSFEIEHRVVMSDATVKHLHQQVEVVERDAGGGALRMAGAVHDITRRKEAEEQIRRLAYYDPLTGLPNRRLITEQLGHAIARAERQRSPVAVVFVDLDHFKRVNDTFGHAAGDDLLRTVGVRLASALRGCDAHSIARLGGDEFIVLLPDLRRPEDAAGIAQRLVDTLAEPVLVQGTEIFVGGSVGVAMYPEDGADADVLLMNADIAMYRAKSAGRGGFQLYDRSMNAQAFERLQTEGQLRRALERNEFLLYFQPRVAADTGCIVGAEGLIRWQHPERGLLEPADFISLAEDSGLIIPIGEWAIEAACRQVAAWKAQDLDPVPVAVNLAANHLCQRSLPGKVGRTLRRYGVSPEHLQVEVTESILLGDPELSMRIARELSSMGVQLSIDDFGTGYSSLGYLKRLPITTLKIDRSFVRDLGVDVDDEAIVGAIIALAHSLKLKVVAEGVETQGQVAFLRSLGCDEYQGYLLNPPVAADDFARMLTGQPLIAAA